MKIFELFQPIVEGYKEAQTDFEKSVDVAEVKSTIDAYKQLVNKNQYQGNERNIDYWRKQGWEKFKLSVKALSDKPTKTEVKRSKNAGKSITLSEGNDWLIIIPLDKTASCFHGKNTDWCTTKPFANHYERYFYEQDVTLIYFLHKPTGNKWAIAVYQLADVKCEYFDRNNRQIDQTTFDQQTQLDSQKYIDQVMWAEHQPALSTARDEYKARLAYIKSKMPFRKVDSKLEESLLYTKRIDYIIKYCKTVKGRWPDAESIIERNDYYWGKYKAMFGID